MAELDVLRRLGDQIVPPPFEALRETARRRSRRTAVVASLAVAATVAVVSATTVYVGRDADREQEPAPPVPTSRPLTYADDSTIHYGNDTIEAEGPVVELDVTDYGVGFRTDDGRIWFTDGSTPDRLGTFGETGPGYRDPWPLMSHPGWMLSSNAGPRLVWFEFPTPGAPEVVTYDTATRREVARDAVGLEAGHTAAPAELSERFVYWFKDPNSDTMAEEQTLVRYDPGTGEQSPITEPELLEDLDRDAAVRSVRLKGDGRWETAPHGFHYSDGMSLQIALSSEKETAGVNGLAPVGPGDMVPEDVDGHRFVFEPPPDYTDKAGVAWLVQWLDNQTVVVVSPLPNRTDLIACHLESKTCDVAASAPAGIVVPELGESRFIG
jgi:hypothetical protein